MKLNDKILSSFFLVAFLTVVVIFSNTSQVYAANTVQVYKDGVELQYTDAQPQIINDRTMVPLAETAAHFGMTYVWNAETATMVFSGTGRTMVHTVYDNKIYVNGTPVQFDFSSVIVNDRTLMPIRMLAEAIGCAVEWSEAGIVDIWTDAAGNNYAQASGGNQYSEDDNNSNSSSSSNYPSSGSSDVGLITIYSVTQDKQNIETGQAVRISVDTNRSADCVKITDFDGNLLEESDTYDEDSQGRYFMLEIYPDQIGESTLRIYAGSDYTYSPASKSISINVIENKKSIIIENILLGSKSVAPRDYVDVTLVTSKNVKRLEVLDKDGYVVKNVKTRAGSTSNYYEWDFWFSAEEKAGTYTYTVKAYDDEGGSETETFEVTVKSSSSSSSSSDMPEIVKLEDYDDDINADDGGWFIVKTNANVTKVELRDSRDSLCGSTSKYTKDGSYRIWEFYFVADESGTFRIYAFDNDNNYDYESVGISVY